MLTKSEISDLAIIINSTEKVLSIEVFSPDEYYALIVSEKVSADEHYHIT